jgi:hypothetical protein
VTADEFVREYERLVAGHKTSGANIGCVEVKDCTFCIDCVFCERCERCKRSSYATGCVDSIDLTQCQDCVRCAQTRFSERCVDCLDSSYLAYCIACSKCEYCFGCVGLSQKEFHILNQKVSRSEYFRRLKELKALLGALPVRHRA